MEFDLDKGFRGFLRNFNQPQESNSLTDETLSSISNHTPQRLVDYWYEYGFCGFKEGLFWITNPTAYSSLLNIWFDQASIPRDEYYFILARNGFGHLYVWGENSGYKYKIDPCNALIIELKGNEKQIEKNGPTESLQRFFYSTHPKYVDLEDKHGNLLFTNAVKKFGPLAHDEMFTFEPALFLGGEQTLANIKKVNIFIQLEILAKMGTPTVMDINGLAKKAFS